jgi:hypothetical protein
LAGRSYLFPEAVADIKGALRKSSVAEAHRVLDLLESKVGVTTADMETDYPFAQLMTWDDVRAIAKLGMSVGSHTVSHENLRLLTNGELQRELKLSQQTISLQTGMPCRHFSFPYGEWSEALSTAVEAAGYSSAVTTMAGWNSWGTNVFQLKRFAMPQEPYKLAYLVSGIRHL